MPARAGDADIELRLLVDAIYLKYHYDFREYATASLKRRLKSAMLKFDCATLSELLRPFRSHYFLTGEINTRVDDVDAKLRELEERFGAQGTVSHLDGVSVEAEDWHFNVRPSNTEPLLRLNLEALSQELMEQKRDEVLALMS